VVDALLSLTCRKSCIVPKTAQLKIKSHNRNRPRRERARKREKKDSIADVDILACECCDCGFGWLVNDDADNQGGMAVVMLLRCNAWEGGG
jgi:hypothetical protein